MNVREKLIEILRKPIFPHELADPTEAVADYLLDNGVTVQECGEWVYDHWCEFKCSVCGEFSSSKPYKGKENYCPNCGAKMMLKPQKGE